jgi:hypothetical protein
MLRLIPTLAIALVAVLPSLRAQDTRPVHGGHDGHESRPAHRGQDTRAQGDPHAGHHGGKGGMLMVETEPAGAKAGAPVTLKLMIHEADGTMLNEFEVVHEKKVHLIIVREGLDQFGHVHPEIDADGNMTVEFNFPTGGSYRLYADYKPAKKDPAVSTAVVKIAGDAPAAPPLKPNVPGKAKGDGLDAEIAVKGTKAGSPSTITFKVLDPSGQPVKDLEPYLGAMGHLVLISSDGKEYVHVHPITKAAKDGNVEFEAHVAKAGLYKGWGQFQRAGKVHAVPFVVKID